MDTNAVITAIAPSVVTMVGITVIIVYLANKFQAPLAGVISRANNVKAPILGVEVEIAQGINAATKQAASIERQEPLDKLEIAPDEDLEIEQIKIDNSEAVRAVVFAWKPLEQAVKLLSYLHFRDYGASHGTISGIARLRNSDYATEREYQSVSKLRDVVYKLGLADYAENLTTEEAAKFDLSARATVASVNAKIKAFRKNGGERRYQEVIADSYPTDILPFRRR